MQTTSGGYAQTFPKDEFDDLCALADEEMDPANEVRIIASQLWYHRAMQQAVSLCTLQCNALFVA